MERSRSNRVINILLGVSVFFITVWPIIPALIWALTILYWIFTGGFKGVKFLLPPKSYVILLASFYLVYAFGLLWSHDMEYGLRDVWIKIPMLVFPLFFSLFIIDSQTIRFVKTGFVGGCIVACLICLCKASCNFYYDHSYSWFFYTGLSVLMFPAYFAMCLNLAVLILMSELFKDGTMKNKKIYTIVIVFLISVIILLSEKMALIAAIITIPFYLIAEAMKRNKLKNMMLKISGFLLLLIIALFFYFKSVDRFSQIPEAIKSFQTERSGLKPDSYYNSSVLRLTLWKYGLAIFKEHWLFGVGTGDIQMEEIKRFKADNFQYGVAHPETPPGQYIHVAIILGVFGLLFLLGIYFVPLYFSFKYKDYLYAGFLLIYIINSTTGTVLSASSVLLYGFFNSFLFVLLEQDVREKPVHS